MHIETSGAFELIHSNRLEQLAEHLADSINESDDALPLVPATVIVPHPGMARWLKLWLAQRLGICANIDFPLPGAFAWQILSAWIGPLPAQSSFERKTLLWRILSLLPELAVEERDTTITSCLQNDINGLRSYRLAARLTEIFDHYLVYRSDWLLAWEQGRMLGLGDQEVFQAKLWRHLVANTTDLPPSTLFQKIFDQVDALPPAATLPQKRIHCFGLSQLAPLYVNLLQVAARKHQVRFYQLNPSLHYWADLVSERELARLKALWTKHGRKDQGDYFEVGHPLLSSWGKPGRFLLKQLHEGNLDNDVDLFVHPERNTLLHKLQKSILHIEPSHCKFLSEKNDHSFTIHGCPNRLREVEVLQDALLAAFQNDPTLKPSDVVIMVPKINDYASLITAVFETAPKEHRIPYRIADRSQLEQHPIIHSFRTLLSIDNCRFTCNEILEFLATPALARRFDISSSERNILVKWMKESGIRWGIDGAFRAELGVGNYADYTWEYGLQRLFVGYACGDNVEEWRGVAPYGDIEGQSVQALGKLTCLLDRLCDLRKTLQTHKTLKEWMNILRQLIDDFFSPTPEDSETFAALDELRHVLTTLNDTNANMESETTRLSIAVVRAALDTELSQVSLLSRFPGTGMTVCTLVPLRAVPFRLIAILGLNSSEFPCTASRDSLNLMFTHPREGDRLRRDDERFLFLEALLAARDTVHLSYVAKSSKDGKPRSPSILIEELIEFFSHQNFSDDLEKAKNYLIRHHRLYPFCTDYFSGEETQRSFAHQWLLAARTTPTQSCEKIFIPSTSKINKEIPKEIKLDDLLRFYLNPSKFQLREHLGIDLDSQSNNITDEEPFSLDALERYLTRDQLFTLGLEKGTLPKTLSPALRAKGLFPAGKAGENRYFSERESIETLVNLIRESSLETKTDLIKFELPFEDILLNGLIKSHHKNVVLSRVGSLRGKYLLQAWIHHLIYTHIFEENSQRYVFGINNKKISTMKFFGLEKAFAYQQLSGLIDIYRSSFTHPILLFPDTGFSYIEAIETEKKAHEATLKFWNGNNEHSRREKEDVYTSLFARGQEPIDSKGSINEQLFYYAKKIFTPLYKNIEK